MTPPVTTFWVAVVISGVFEIICTGAAEVVAEVVPGLDLPQPTNIVVVTKKTRKIIIYHFFILSSFPSFIF
jgi:hypothetical protein